MRCSPFFLSIAKADVPDLKGHGWGFPLIPQSEHHLLVSTGKLMWGVVYMRMDTAMNDKFVQEHSLVVFVNIVREALVVKQPFFPVWLYLSVFFRLDAGGNHFVPLSFENKVKCISLSHTKSL